ncbi:phage tail protein [Vreelandella arctica]|uniref:phage tail protein n=1 Tax=Vreelandella arctica TaxID=3126499 RepID=UPI00300E1354
MANFPGLVLTQAGRNLQAKAQIGAPLTFSRVALGDGISAAPDAMAALDNEQLSLSIQDFEVIGDGTSRMRVIMTNESLDNGFFVRELGVFAEDPDTGEEQLYSYSNAGDQPDFLPAGGGATLVENVFDLYTVVGNAQNVTAKISDYITIATKQDIDEIRPMLLPEDGTVNQLLRKASNAPGDTVWFTPEEGIGVQVESREERRVAVESQRIFALTGVTTQGLAVYVNGERYGRHRWQPLGATQVRFQSELSDGDEVLFVQNEEVGEIEVARVSLTGEGLIYPGTTNEYVITDFDFAAEYSANASRGTLTRDGDTLTLVLDAGEPDGALDLNIARDGAGVTYALAVGAPRVRTPQITYPGSGDTGVDLQPTFSATAFATYPASFDDQASATWVVARDEALTDIVIEVTTSEDLTSWRPDEALPLDTDLFVGVTYTGATLGDSAPAAVIAFRTTAQYIVQPTITSPVNGATNIHEKPILETSAFQTFPAGVDTQRATSWWLYDDEDNVAWESLNNISNLTSIALPAGVIKEGKTYRPEAQHHGNSLPSSDRSPESSFTTVTTFKALYFATINGTGTLVKVDPSTLQPVANMDGTGRQWSTIGAAFTNGPTVGHAQTGIVWGDDEYLYVGGSSSGVAKFDKDCNLIGYCDLSDATYAPGRTMVTFGGGYLWCGGNKGIIKIDPATMTVEAEYSVDSVGGYGIAYMAKTDTIAIGGQNTSAADDMSVFAPASAATVGSIASSGSGVGLPFYSGNLDRVFMIRQYEGEFWGYVTTDPINGGFRATSPILNGTPPNYMYGGMFWSEAKQLGYAVSYYGQFWTISDSTAALAAINPSDMGSGTQAACIDKEGAVYIACRLDTSNGDANADIVVYDGTTRLAETSAGWLLGWSNETSIASGCMTINVSPTQLQSIPLGG